MSHPVMIWEKDLVDKLDFKVGENIFTLSSSQDSFAIPAISPDGLLLALSDNDGGVHLFNSTNGEWMRSFQLDQVPSALTFSVDGDLLIIGSEDGTLSIIDLKTNKILSEWIVQDGFVNGLAFGRGEKTMIIAGADGNINAINLDVMLSGHSIEETTLSRRQLPPQAVELSIPAHTDVITHLEASPNGKKLLTSSWDGTARVWDTINGSVLLTLAGHKGRVWHAAFHPDGKRIATAGADGSVIIWDAESGEQLFVLSTQPLGIYNLSFSRDGKFLAASGIDGSVRVYVMPIEDLMALARDRLTRQLTKEECQRYLHVDRCP